jgi:phage tail sheath protein FI
LAGGDSNGQLTQGEYTTGYDAFANKEDLQIDFLIAPAGAQSVAPSIHKYLNSIAVQRKDCVAVASVKYQDLLNDSISAGIGSYVSALSENSSYLVVDGNHIKVYNKYEDKYEWIPAASSTAGVMAATDAVSAPWFSPAGSRRGQYVGVTEVLVNPSKTERDVMYKSGVNPIVSSPGQGIMLFGDKTHLSRPSAFDRINVRRLFLVIERAISRAGENVMFEFNDEFTRAEFVNIVEPFLREIQGRRGITDFRVVCDDTNNTPEVVDRNEFIASCFIKPARSINYVTLNFVAVRTGVEFEEVVGI